MDKQLSRQVLESDYRSYLEIITQKGLSFDGPRSDDDIKKVSDSDLNVLTRRMRDLARTPTS